MPAGEPGSRKTANLAACQHAPAYAFACQHGGFAALSAIQHAAGLRQAVSFVWHRQSSSGGPCLMRTCRSSGSLGGIQGDSIHQVAPACA
jgi:hypothetical protein